MDYCLLSLGVVAIAALVVRLAGHSRPAALLIAFALAAQLLIAVAARLLRSGSGSVRAVAKVLLWATVSSSVSLATLTVVTFAVEWPHPVARFLQLDDARRAS